MSWLTSIARFVNRGAAMAVHQADHGDDDLAEPAEVTKAAVGPEWGIDPGGWIIGDKRIVRVPTVRTSPLKTQGPVMIVWHWTATAWGTGAGIAKRVSTYKKGDRASSMHCLVEHDGTFYILAPATVGTWCQGGATAMKFVQDHVSVGKGRDPRWVPSPDLKVGVSANALAFSFELVNLGEVHLVNGRWRAWPFEPGSPAVEEKDTRVKGKKRYHRFTDAQVDSAARSMRALVRAYDLRRDQCTWTHQKIDPTRKTDPGPVWVEDHLPDVLDYAFGS
jgi:hypothetical protein